MSNSIDERTRIHAAFTEELQKRELSNDENFDKAILTLSSASLAVSVAFLRGMQPTDGVCFLVLAWISLFIAICATIVSFRTSQFALRHQQKIADRYYLEDDKKAYAEANPFAKWTEILANSSAVCFVAGIVFLLLFFGFNLPTNDGKEVMARDNTGKNIGNGEFVLRNPELRGGASTPRMQAVPPPTQNTEPAPAASNESRSSDSGSSEG